MKLPFVWATFLVFSAIQIALPEKIQNIQDLQKLAEEGDSNAQCLLGLQEMIGGDLYDPRIIDTVTVEQILLNKVEKWQDQLRFLPSYESGSEFETGSKANEAFKWIKKSADQGNKVGLYCLARFYIEGIGVAKNREEAMKYLKKSAQLGYLKSYVMLGAGYSLYYNDEKQSLDWLWQGFDQGDLDCRVEIGRRFLIGKGVAKNESKGFQLIEEAYQSGNKRAISALGLCYLDGLGTTKDPTRAFALFKEGSNASRHAKYLLGRMYLTGNGTEKDPQKGAAIVEEVAATGDHHATTYLGQMYANGWGVKVDQKKAISLYQEAAKAGNSEAMLELGKAYYAGSMVKGDKELARSWLQKAKDRGNKQANELLKKIDAPNRN